MAIYNVFRVQIVNNIVVGDPEPWIFATPPDSVNGSDGFNLTTTINSDGEEVINQDDWLNGSDNGAGTNHNGASSEYLWDGHAGNPHGPFNGHLYFDQFDDSIQAGDNVHSLISGLNRNFEIPLGPFAACFARGTSILTPTGERSIEDLSIGDPVLTADGREIIIKWIGHRRVTFLFADHLRPIRVCAGAFGPDKPHRDLLLSPEHRVVLSTEMVRLLFGENQVLATAHSLVNDSTIRVCRNMKEVEYYHLLFSQHEIIVSENIASESFYPDRNSIDHMSAPTRAELLELFPELRCGGGSKFRSHARPVLKRAEIRLLADILPL